MDKQSESLCFSCKRVCKGACSWSKSFKPVKGWVAQPTKVGVYRGKVTDSYLVKECPKYVRDDREEVGIYDIVKDLHVSIKTLYKSTIKELNEMAKKRGVGFHIEVLPTVDNTTEFVKVYD